MLVFIFSGYVLKMTSTLNEIIDAMKTPVAGGGLNFLKSITGLPPFTFVAFEGVAWLMDNVEDVSTEAKAADIFKTMIDKKFVCHA